MPWIDDMPWTSDIRPVMTRERAERVRDLRRTHTWRAVAETTYTEWGTDATWSPPSNQLAGMALTHVASEVLGVNIDLDEPADDKALHDQRRGEFRQQLESLLNRYSQENGSDTPDFILAGYLTDALDAFDKAVRERERWYGHRKGIHEECDGPVPIDQEKEGRP